MLKNEPPSLTVPDLGSSDRHISLTTGILTFLKRNHIGMPNPITDFVSPRVLADTRRPRVESVIRSPQANRVLTITVLCTTVLVIIVALWTSHQGWLRPSDALFQKQGTPSSGHYAVLTWKASPSIVVGYHVYRAENSAGPYMKLNSSPVRETTYKDSSVQAGHTYFYQVTAVDAKGRESVFSNQARGIVPSP